MEIPVHLKWLYQRANICINTVYVMTKKQPKNAFCPLNGRESKKQQKMPRGAGSDMAAPDSFEYILIYHFMQLGP